MLRLCGKYLQSCRCFGYSRKDMGLRFINWNRCLPSSGLYVGNTTLISRNLSALNANFINNHTDDSSATSATTMNQEKLIEFMESSSNKFSNCWRKLRSVNTTVHCSTGSSVSLTRITDVLLACGVNSALFENNGQILPHPAEVSSIYYNVELTGEQLHSLNELAKFRDSCGVAPFLVLDFTIPKPFPNGQDLILDLLERLRPTVIRCRQSDVLYLIDGYSEELSRNGTDSQSYKNLEKFISSGCKLAKILSSVVCITASSHTVINSCGTVLVNVPIDTKQLNRISGIGNVMGVLCAATLLAERTNPFLSVITAIVAYKHTAGEAVKESKGPGSTGISLLDQFYRLCLSPDKLSDDVVTISKIPVESST
ncbi:hypothetical protein IE077_001466 [Cardiosporidium cionae]|uniref:hydroxyethylthiazole kinase n=1 Tax=Cardiosporidium cionae TaxID=476202 RepID=A0ABQ7JG43_9APIC|nr:hypothetical protein IE077_001466 [Cardiosporidium cionae]|eukprot:KAF8822991.1 hypothetical protein IE077_001466 [Cardiosporidium cionae]